MREGRPPGVDKVQCGLIAFWRVTSIRWPAPHGHSNRAHFGCRRDPTTRNSVLLSESGTAARSSTYVTCEKVACRRSLQRIESCLIHLVRAAKSSQASVVHHRVPNTICLRSSGQDPPDARYG